jgi:tetratricopeptide (TPR) repeat protein
LPWPDHWLILFIVGLALALRILFLMQYSDAPDFTSPFGDARIYFDRAMGILRGEGLLGPLAFQSSPVYPIYLAGVFRIFGQNFFLLRLIQAVFGAANCGLIFLLSKKMSRGDSLTALLAGLFAAGYGTLVLFDGDLLMISFTLFFMDLAFWGILAGRQTGRWLWAAASGLSFGLVLLDRTALLPFVLLAVWYLGSGMSLKTRLRDWAWKPVVGFILGTSLMLLPVLLHNLAEGDFVLVSPNAGINLFIGNNPTANGSFHIPVESGLVNQSQGLFASARAVAEKTVGKKLKPSQVSRFWAGRARDFLLHSGNVFPLYETKLKLMFNAKEVPNHLDFDFYRLEVAPILKGMFVSFGWILPLACLGIWQCLREKAGPADKLSLAFILTVMITLLPFFIVDRYRLPMVPFLILFAARAVTDLYRMAGQKHWRNLAWAAVLLALGFGVTHTRPMYIPFCQARVNLAKQYFDRGLNEGERRPDDFKQAVLQCKQALEEYPAYEPASKALVDICMEIGCYSAAIAILENRVQASADNAGEEAQWLSQARARFQEKGDLVPQDSLPKTDFEQGLEAEAAGKPKEAAELYENLVQRDPFQIDAFLHLAGVKFNAGNYEGSLAVLRQGLRGNPNNLSLLKKTADYYFGLNDQANYTRAKQRLDEATRQSAAGI